MSKLFDETDFSDLLKPPSAEAIAESKKRELAEKSKAKHLRKKQVRKEFNYRGYIIQEGTFHPKDPDVITWRAYKELFGFTYLYSHSSEADLKKKVDRELKGGASKDRSTESERMQRLFGDD